MPRYDYVYTDADGGTFETFHSMHEPDLTEYEGRPCRKGVVSPKMRTRFGEGNHAEPIEMMSIAVDSKAEVAAFRTRNPGVEISDRPGDPKFGIPIATSRSEKLRVLKTEGFQEK